MQTDRGSWLEIDMTKVLHNYHQVKGKVDRESEKQGRKISFCAVLKANAYGLGLSRIAALLEGEENSPDSYAVACLSEALELRKVVPEKEILILGYVPAAYYDVVLENRITLPMYREDLLLAFSRAAEAFGRKGLCHIAVNSGMNRLGFLPTEENAETVKKAFFLPGIEITGIFTHLAIADEKDKTVARMQMKRFDDFLALLKEKGVTLPKVHAGASPTICDMPEYYKDMVRSGLTLPGYYASEDVNHEEIRLLPAVKLKANLGNAMPVKAGEGIGYGYTCHLTRDSIVGLVPIGCSDGLPRELTNRFYVTIRGIKCPQIGRICMDHFMIDITDVPNPVIGEEVVVYGDGPYGGDHAMGVMDVAEELDTIPDELLTVIGPRIPRVYI